MTTVNKIEMRAKAAEVRSATPRNPRNHCIQSSKGKVRDKEKDKEKAKSSTTRMVDSGVVVNVVKCCFERQQLNTAAAVVVVVDR